MDLNEKLFHFLKERTWKLTEDWYASIDKSKSGGIYTMEDPEAVQKMKEQNHEFYKRLNRLFLDNREEFFDTFEEWVIEVATDQNHIRTPLHFILKEFFRVQDQYIELVSEFSKLHKDEISEGQTEKWYREVMEAVGKIIGWFTQEHYEYAQRTLNAQREMIYELSSPVISLDRNRALLPLVGDIDTERANYLLENTLLQCSQKLVSCLYIDLSGVVIVDTMVAQQLFRLVEALRLLGIKSVISGIRPEIAQTAVQLGVNFNEITTVSNLEQALSMDMD